MPRDSCCICNIWYCILQGYSILIPCKIYHMFGCLMKLFVVSGAYDLIQQPKNISETAKRNVCFYMFVDEETDRFLRNSSGLDSSNKLGLWRTVVIHNLPYDDPRRNGKVNYSMFQQLVVQ